MAVASVIVRALVIVMWSARIRVRSGGVGPATGVLLALSLAPFVFLYAAWIASDAWLSEHLEQPGASPINDFIVAGMLSSAVIVGGILVGWEAGRQRRWVMAIMCICAEGLAIASLGILITIVVLLGLLSQLGSVVGGGWR